MTEENEDPPHSNSIIEKEAPPEEMDVISSCTANNINNNNDGVYISSVTTNASSSKCRGISNKRDFFRNVERDYDVVSKSLNIHWTTLHNRWVSNNCCSDSADKKMRCNSCHLTVKNWKRTLLRVKNATATTSSSLTAPPSKKIVLEDMMQSIRTILEDKSANITNVQIGRAHV